MRSKYKIVLLLISMASLLNGACEGGSGDIDYHELVNRMERLIPNLSGNSAEARVARFVKGIVHRRAAERSVDRLGILREIDPDADIKDQVARKYNSDLRRADSAKDPREKKTIVSVATDDVFVQCGFSIGSKL